MITHSFYKRSTGERVKSLSPEEEQKVKDQMWDTLINTRPVVNIKYVNKNKSA